MRLAFVCLTVFGSCLGDCQAGIIPYTTRATFLTAAGPLSGTENFNEFTTDTQFRTASVAVNNMTITGTTGNNGSATNMIDVAPNSFPGFYNIDSTPYLLGDLVQNEAITFKFTTPVTAWGGDFSGIGDGGRPTRLDIFNTASVLIGSIPFSSDSTNTQQQFYGFTTTGGDTVGSVVIIDSSPDPANNDVFGLDNIAFVTASAAVPEPSSLAMMIAGVGLSLTALRRRPN